MTSTTRHNENGQKERAVECVERPRTCFFCRRKKDEKSGDDFMTDVVWKTTPKGRTRTVDACYDCLIYCPEVYVDETNAIRGISKALKRSRALKCNVCHLNHAAVGCHRKKCRRTYHLGCARRAGHHVLDDCSYAVYCKGCYHPPEAKNMAKDTPTILQGTTNSNLSSTPELSSRTSSIGESPTADARRSPSSTMKQTPSSSIIGYCSAPKRKGHVPSSKTKCSLTDRWDLVKDFSACLRGRHDETLGKFVNYLLSYEQRAATKKDDADLFDVIQLLFERQKELSRLHGDEGRRVLQRINSLARSLYDLLD